MIILLELRLSETLILDKQQLLLMDTQPATRHNLPPQPTSFIGREAEITEITALLDDSACRLLTLVGPGGIGKTRLAIEVAARKLDAFPNGVFFVPLQPLTSHEHIVPAVAASVGYQFQPDKREPHQQLLDYLSHKSILLLMDNFEHLMEGVNLMSDILAVAPELKMLVTSRTALNLREEQLYDLPGLAFPRNDQFSANDHYSAIELFEACTLHVNRRVSLKAELPNVVHICQLLDGMPLAIEIAASWTRTLSCMEIAVEIQNSLEILETPLRNVPQRHRSVRAVFDWSWRLLPEEERAVFRRLSVFRGGCTLEAAQAVTGTHLRTLQALIDKSFIRRNTQSGRYDIHELMRQYGEERLEESGEADSVRDAHMQYYADAVRKREADLKGPQQVEMLDDIECNFENVRAGWNRAVTQRNAGILNQMMEMVTLFCEMRGRYHEGLELFELTLQEIPDVPEEPFQSIRWWLKLFWLHLWQLRRETIESIKLQIEEVLAEAHRREDVAMIALSFYELAEYKMVAGNYHSALPIYKAALARYYELDDRFNAVRALRGITYCCLFLGDGHLNEFINFHQEHLNLAREVGDPIGLGHALYDDAALINRTQHDQAAFERRLQEAHDLFESAGDQIHAAFVKCDLAFIAVYDRKDFDRASKLIDGAEAIAEVANNIMLRANVLWVSGFGAVMEEDYSQSAKVLNEAITINDPVMSPGSRLYLAISYLGLGNYVSAKRHFYDALRNLNNARRNQRMISIIMTSALILAYEGQKSRAAELLGLAFAQRGDNVIAAANIPLFIRSHAELKAELGEDAYNAAWERGKSLDLETVALELLKAFKPDDEPDAINIPFPLHVLTANQALREPLTERELQILQLISGGLTNQEIAEHLVISVNTVKTHLKNIFSKLEATNRMQAAQHARHLKLV